MSCALIGLRRSATARAKAQAASYSVGDVVRLPGRAASEGRRLMAFRVVVAGPGEEAAAATSGMPVLGLIQRRPGAAGEPKAP